VRSDESRTSSDEDALVLALDAEQYSSATDRKQHNEPRQTNTHSEPALSRPILRAWCAALTFQR
jgi:hypothetical protein